MYSSLFLIYHKGFVILTLVLHRSPLPDDYKSVNNCIGWFLCMVYYSYCHCYCYALSYSLCMCSGFDGDAVATSPASTCKH